MNTTMNRNAFFEERRRADDCYERWFRHVQGPRSSPPRCSMISTDRWVVEAQNRGSHKGDCVRPPAITVGVGVSS